jgi:uracil permease
MGAVVAIIGLELAPVAAGQAGLLSPDGKPSGNLPSLQEVQMVSMFTLFTGIFGSLLFRGFMQAIPVLAAIMAGTLLALAKGMVDTSLITRAPWFALPEMHAPVFNLNAVFIIFPACIVVLAEHISHLVVTGKITGSDLVRDPGLHRSLLADGISNILSGLAGSPPNTTYGENIGVMAITRVYSVWVIRGAAILAIAFSCIGKISAAISSIPIPVIGGISLLLYGVIAVQGIRIFVEQRVDFSLNKNMILGAVTFIAGISGASVRIGSVSLKGMALAAVTGVILSTLLYLFEKSGMIRQKSASPPSDANLS